tara:strand:+ start:80 stop:400 length:321 start_codon:yes stop_codon:yes gene_type:complete
MSNSTKRKSYLEKFAKKYGHKNTGNNKGTNQSFSSLGSLGSALKKFFTTPIRNTTPPQKNGKKKSRVNSTKKKNLTTRRLKYNSSTSTNIPKIANLLAENEKNNKK